MKIVSLNAERENHLDTVREFLCGELPGVFCVQEILKSTFDMLCAEENLRGYFAPMTSLADDGSADRQQGVAILTDQPCFLREIQYYENFTEDYPAMAGRNDRPRVVLLTVGVGAGDDALTVATTHFTWTPDGKASDEQRVNLESLLELIDTYPSLVLCGDFNAPRGGEIHQKLSQKLRDTVPLDIKSTLDPEKHRCWNPFVVDGIFVTPDLLAHETSVVSGVSDHCALVLDVSRK